MKLPDFSHGLPLKTLVQKVFYFQLSDLLIFDVLTTTPVNFSFSRTEK